ncbi:MAG: CehA/McbA family metallohydrolase [Kiritimatiellae bacterium]|nr:CehA/McbA family metallohydrolase [Kiritimatiellia bacterium]
MPRSVVMGMLGAALAGSAAENVLRDPGFEEGGTGWSLDALHVLVTNSAAAASGRVCLRGETTAPRQAARLIQTVEVRSNRVYRFRVRARGTPGVFMALFATFPRRTARERIAAWDSISPQWRTFETPPFTPSADGRLVLELISPSSFAGKPGRLWVDDVELIEEVPPRGVELSAAQGVNDEPALTRGADGALYAAWISFRDGRDTLQGARIEVAAGDDARVTHRWTVDDGGGDVALLGPRLVAAGDGAVLVYAREQRDEWDIAVVKLSARGPEFRQLLEDGGTDVDPAVASHRDLVWVAWEGSRDGRRRIGVRAVVGGRAGPIEWLSDPSVNACDPAIAVTAAGEVVVAWHDFRNGRVDIWARSREARTGGWSPARRLTTAPAIDRHPLLLARGDEVWMLYETAQVSEYRVGATIGRRLRLVRITPQGVEEPAAGDGPLAEGSEGPAAAFDESGRLWVAWLAAVAGPKPRDWNVKLAAFAGDRWSAAREVSSLKGMDRRPGLAVVGGTVWVLHQYDNMPANWPNEAAADLARSDVRLAGVPADAPPAAPPTWQCATESAEAFPPADLREARGEETPGWWVEHRGHRWRLFFGDLHEHSDVSPCGRTRDQSVDESYQHMRDLAVHDFACVTDHGYAINSYLWRYLAKLARANEDRGRFLTFLGQEWTSSFEEYSANHPYGFYGHRNLILGDPRFPRWWNEKNRQTPAQLWEDLRRMNADFVTIPHQLADTGNVPTDWSFVDETAQPVAEIFQTRGSYEHEGAPRQARATTPRGWFLQDAWARGIVIGVIASPDHGGGYGKACVYATELSRAAILEALRARRCYGTTGAKILLDVRVGGCFMGEASRSRPPPTVPVEVRVLAPAEIARVDVCRNNVFIYSREVGARQSEFTYVDREVPAGPVWYYVRVQQTDGELAWTSPVWWGAR